MTSSDYMTRALFHAARGRGRTSPNPLVGAVVVSRDDIVVGYGYHERAGEAHAEVRALDMAGPRRPAARSTATLEPCCHVGRTGPCVVRIVEADVARVVAAVEDPNPLGAGPGLRPIFASTACAVEVGLRGRDGDAPQPAVLHQNSRSSGRSSRSRRPQPRRAAWPPRAGTADGPDLGAGESARPCVSGRSRCHRRRCRHRAGRRPAADGAGCVPGATTRPGRLRPAASDAPRRPRALDRGGRPCHHRDDSAAAGAADEACRRLERRGAHMLATRGGTLREAFEPAGRRLADRIAVARRRRRHSRPRRGTKASSTTSDCMSRRTCSGPAG